MATLVSSSGRPFLISGRPRAASDAITQGVVIDVGPTGVYASWTSGSASSTTFSCGTSPGSFSITAADAGTQTSVTSHSGIIVGLTPNTTYYCQCKSGAAVIATFAITTAPALATTPILGVSVVGSAVQPVAGQIAADTFYNCIGNDNITYVTGDDNHGFGGATSSNMMVGKFTNELPLTGTNVNTLSGYGSFATSNGDDTHSPKLSGLYSLGGKLYGFLGRQYNTTSTGYPAGTTSGVFPQTSGSIIRSDDHGATWLNPQQVAASQAATSTGTMMSPASTAFFSSTTNFSAPSPVMYGIDDGTLGPRVDNADAYVYCTSNDGYWNNGNTVHLARCPKAKLSNLSGADWQYFTGGDGSQDSAWSSSPAGKATLISNTGKIGYTAVQYLPKLNRYLLLTWYYPNPASTSSTVWLAYEAAHPWGPWTLVTSMPWSPSGLYNPVPLVRDALVATGNGRAMRLLAGGDYQNQTPYYKLWTVPLVLNT